jgi:hypothetical protein
MANAQDIVNKLASHTEQLERRVKRDYWTELFCLGKEGVRTLRQRCITSTVPAGFRGIAWRVRCATSAFFFSS